ncbi:MAG: hypothetical protein KIT74_03765 [Fimbriimonadales bacterium]|nr:hypothetical protein [Fimbriimonadales bacterium]
MTSTFFKSAPQIVLCDKDGSLVDCLRDGETLISFLTSASIVVVFVIAVLTAILVPVFSSARRSANVQTSLANMRQLHQAIDIYRSNWSGSDSFLSPRSIGDLGLPPASLYGPALLGLSNSLFVSPCGPGDTIHKSGLGGVNGYIIYGPSA